MIKCLPKEVQAKLRSGVAVFSLHQCVEELVLNSIDAGATCVAVRLDTEACRVQVVDNGCGMERTDVERVGNRYFTSKCNSLEDLENLRFYGFRGEAVASIAALSTLLEISSRSRLSVKTFVKVFKEGKGMEVFEAGSTRPSAGTTVMICNFFHNMPVRRKRIDPVLECERVRQRVEAIALMHPSISFTLKNDCTGAMVVQLSKARNTYYRFIQIHGLVRAQKLGEIGLSHGQFEMSGYIGREGHYNSSLQFLFVNCRLVLKTRIHKLLNFLLKKVSGSTRQNVSPGVSPDLATPKKRAGTELHGVYILNIKCHYSEYDVCLEPAKTLIEFKDWDGVLSCVEEGVKQFLNRENLVAELSPEDIQDYIHGDDFTVPEASPCRVEDSAGAHSLAPTLGITQESCEGKTLMSKAVHRTVTQDLDRADSVQADDSVDSVCEREKEMCGVEAPKDLEQTREHVSVIAACKPHSLDPETEGCDTITGISPLMSESLKDIADVKDEHHSVQLEKTMNITDSGCDGLWYSVKSDVVKEGKKQCMSQQECKDSADDPREQHSVTHSTKTNESCCESPLHTSAERLVKRTSDAGRAELQLGSVGFITHLVPQPRSTRGLSRVSSQGPASAQDLLPEKQCICKDLQIFPLAAESTDTSTQKSAIYPQSGGSTFESHEKSLWAPKRKMTFLGEASVIASKTSKVMSCPKLALPVEAGSLDRFRRVFGKQTRTRSQPLETNVSQTELSDALEMHPVQVNDFPITLSEYTRLKSRSGKPRSSQGTLAAKLSRLKHHQVEDKCNALEEPHQEIQNVGCSLKSTITDTFLQDTSNPEKQTDSPLPSSSDIITDNNANYQQAEIEKHNNTCDCAESEEFCSHAFTTVQSSTTQALSADSNGESVQMVSEHKTLHSSGEMVNSTGEDGPLSSNSSIQEEKTQSESMATESSDWLEHFDDSAGKLVYINKVTGLSKYEGPTVEETQVPCTTDVTTMSVSVISKKGFEYKCYPFQTELVLPFLPRSGAERVLSSGQDNSGNSQAANSLSSMFSEWTNPVFVRPPEVAVDVTSGQAEGLAVKIYNILYPYRFTKDMIHSMKVVHQVDKKFIACLINTRDQVDVETSDAEGNLLVLVDQHAAHERVRLENLVTNSYEEDPEAPGQKRLCSSSVSPPLEIDVTEEEVRLLRSCQPFLRGLGLEVAFAEMGEPRLLVGKVPACFVEREANESRRGRHNAIKAIVQEYIREQIELLRSAGRVRGTMPLTVLKVLASQACHGAIKFNDSLSVEECRSLVGSLSTCQLPFQCAHGRPSMVPLADLLHLDTDQQDSPRPNLWKLRRMYRAWELFGDK